MTVVILNAETIDRFGYDPDEIDQKSTKPVVVLCAICNETFVREIGLAAETHHCKRIVESFRTLWHDHSRHECGRTPYVAAIRQPPVRLECKVLFDGGKVPYRKLTSDAWYDIASAYEVVVPARGSINVSTGVAVACPQGWYMTVEGRSGLGLKGIFPFRGIIDSTYHNELKVVLINLTDEDYTVRSGDRVAQLVIHQQYHADFAEVSDFSEEYSGRGLAGFGSSGN